MAAAIPTIEPLKITAGDTVKWTRDISGDYSAADGWTLTYYIVGAGVSQVATASGVIFAITIAATVTAPIEAADYLLKGIVSKAAERFVVYSAGLTVDADPTALPTGYDPRSHARKCLDAIKAVLERRATRDDLNYQVNGTGLTVGKIPHMDLVKLLQFYQGEVLREDKADKIARGEASGSMILVRFR